jgi:hypothetical protein
VSLLHLVGDHSSLFATVGILGFIPSAGYVVYKLWIAPPETAADPAHATTRTARPASPAPASMPMAPSAPPAQPARGRTPSIDAGQAEYQQRGQAKTIKVAPPSARPVPPAPPAPPVAAEAVEPAEAQRRAQRLGELGFHTTAPAEKAQTAAVGDQPATVRTQTAELDDILSRIDKVLSENPVMATATSGAVPGPDAVGKPAEPETTKAVAVQPDAPKPDTDQQKLF